MGEAGRVAVGYIEGLVGFFRTGRPLYSDLLADDVVVTIPGTSRISGTIKGKQSMAEAAAAIGSLVPCAPGFTIVIERIIEQGRRVCVLARGHAEAATGRPYNNRYMFFFSVEQGLIKEIVECGDTALIDWSVFGEGHADEDRSEVI